MSNKSGTSSQVISLPQGGGALQGIGEKFSPDLHTGSGNFTVPIALPPGRNGFQPELSLVYSTGNGNGAFGLGWNLSLPGVTRKTSEGIPRYDDAQDTFILSGAEDLVPVEQLPGVIRYRPRTEGLFARIEYHRDASNDYWKVWSKDGLISLYGTRRPDDADPEWQDPAAIADASDRTKVFAWKLSKTIDPFGNHIEYEYERDLGILGPHHWNQLYLQQIRYSDYTDEGKTKFLVSVTFEYEDRPDPFSEYRPGFELRTWQRCQRIAIRTHAEEERLVRTYDWVYLDRRDDLENLEHLLPLNGVSLLSQVKVVGYDGEDREELPPLEFGYTRFEPEGRDFFPLQGRDLPVHSLASPDLEVADLFGNGLPDILEMNGTVRYWRNLGGGRFDLPRQMQEAPAGLRLADQGVQLIDANGDGRIDLLVNTERLAGYYPLAFDGLWDRRSFQRYRVAPSFNLEDPEVQLVDLDGDGVTDAIRSGSRMECFFNDPKEGWKETLQVERKAIEEFPNINFSDPRVKWADMTGDGLQNIVLVYDGNVEYWPNLGYGNWGKRVSMRNSPRFRYGYDPRRILIDDVDGDGLADLVYVDDGKVILWINQSGNGWSEPIEIKGTPSVSDMDAVRLVDLLGIGISGVLWSADATGLSGKNLFFLDFTGGVKPYLLNEMDNHMGSVTRVGYASSTQFYLEDEKRPETHWKTPLPFPVQVVARLEVIDHFSKGKLTTEYNYHQGYWDGAEREFRGFGMVEQCDTENFENYNTAGLQGEEIAFAKVDQKHFSPPTLTKTWFHQGPVGDEFGEWEEIDYSDEFWSGNPQVLERPDSITNFLNSLPRRVKRDALRTLRGQILRTELYAIDGTERQERPYTVTEYLPVVTALPMGESWPEEPQEWQKRVFFPHALAQRVTQWERGDEPMTQFSFTEDYDTYGLPRSQLSIAVPRDRDFRVAAVSDEPYWATHTITDYAQKETEQTYIVDRVARTTTYEVLNNGSAALFDLRDAIADGLVERQVVGQTLNFYDGAAFEGLPFGDIDKYGALVRTETLVLTEEILHEAYKSGDTVLIPAEKPPYLVPDGATEWTAEYIEEFRNPMPALAGYIYQSGGGNSEYASGYFAITQRRRYDFQDDPEGQGRGLVKIMRDALGHDTRIVYDPYDLLPTEVTDPVGLTTNAIYDYRVLQPRQVTDANGNRQVFGFTPSGLPAWIAVMGKDGEVVGDTEEEPGSRFAYDFLAFKNSPPEERQPISVRTIQRVHYVNDTDIPLPERNETIETVEYSDGFGRLLQKRSQAEDIRFGDSAFGDAGLPADLSQNADAIGQLLEPNAAPRVVVSGGQTYDNKGQVIEKYEPFFSTGWDYAPPDKEKLGQKVTMYYDPRGQVIRTVNPDGSEQRVIYGVPVDLLNPDQFTPTPWEAYTYDANDNAGRTHAEVSLGYQHHWNTPTSITIDALGRTIETVERNRAKPAPGDPLPSVEEYRTRSKYDIRGNLLVVTDALDRVAFEYVYDLANRPLRIDSIDAGVRRTVLNAVGNAIEQRDSKGVLSLQAYDQLNRLTHLWARDRAEQELTLRSQLLYGDSPELGLSTQEAKAANLLGQLYQHYDEAGLLTLNAYDFKGNLLDKQRQVIRDAAILSVFDPPPPNWQVQAFRVNWQPPNGITLTEHASELLDETAYQTTLTYDALNRVKTMLYPEDVTGERKLLRPLYNRAGALERVELNGTAYVERIAYNAKGQRILIAYGNGVMTRYTYDLQTFRLVRLRSERYDHPNPLTYHPIGTPLQDFAYEYDLAGNILSIQDRSPASGIINNPEAAMQVADPQLTQLLASGNALIRHFEYDPLYRLLSADGRECDKPPVTPPWIDEPRCTDLTKTRAYTEQYKYDLAGNLKQLQHLPGDTGFTRKFTLVPGNNRLATMSIGQNNYTYTYDANGNLTQENESRYFEWDYSDRMRVYRTQAGNSEPSVHAHYLYDTSGQRVKKLVRKQGGQVEVTVYIDGIFEYHRLVKGNVTQENNTLHVMDNEQRIALNRVGEPFPDNNLPAIKFHLGDNLGSSNIVLDNNGNLINREEYTPYGETSFGSFSKKRYRLTGKERDEESGLYYHGARYYASWLVRWVSIDPLLGEFLDESAYVFNGNNPLIYTDPDGMRKKNVHDSIAITTDRHDKKDKKTGKQVKSLPIQTGVRLKKQYGIENVEIDRNEDAEPKILNVLEQATKKLGNNDGIRFLGFFSHGNSEGVANLGGSFDLKSLDALEKKIKEGKIRFASDAVITIAACNTGTNRRNQLSFAQKFAKVTGAKVIAPSGTGVSVGHKDSSYWKTVEKPNKENEIGWFEFQLTESGKVEKRFLEVDKIDIFELYEQTNPLSAFFKYTKDASNLFNTANTKLKKLFLDVTGNMKNLPNPPNNISLQPRG